VAKYEYKPLAPTKRKSANIRYLLLALVIITLGTGLIVKTYSRDKGVQGAQEGDVSGYALGSETSAQSTPPARTSEPARPVATSQPPIADSRQVTTPPVPAAGTPTTGQGTGFNPAAPPAATMNDETLGRIQHAMTQLQGGNLIAARDSLNVVMGMQMTPEYRAGVKQKMTELAEQWLFSSTVFPGDTLTEMYTVKPGEALATIGKRYNVPYEILMQINKIKRAESLQAGQNLKVIKGPFNVQVCKSTFTLDLYLGGNMYVKSYKVGLGAPGSETPSGRWSVAPAGKFVFPQWTDPATKRVYKPSDPDYPLGSRYIAIRGLEAHNKELEGFALHGTKEPESIGKRSSQGCVRLFNGDVIEVYNLLVPEKSEVLIVD